MRTTSVVLLLIVCAAVLADKPTGDKQFPGHSGDRGRGHRPGGGKDSKEKTAPAAATDAKDKPKPEAGIAAAVKDPAAALPKLPVVQKRAVEIEATPAKVPRAAAGMNMNAGGLGAGANVRGKRDSFGVKIKG